MPFPTTLKTYIKCEFVDVLKLVPLEIILFLEHVQFFTTSRSSSEQCRYKDVRGQVTYIRIDRDGCSKNLIFLSHPLKPVSVRSPDGVIQVKAVNGD